MHRQHRRTLLAPTVITVALLVVLSSASTVAKRPGGEPTFSAPVLSTSHLGVGAAEMMYLGKLDGDRWKDLVVGHFNNGNGLTVAMGTKKGKFKAPQRYRSGPYGGLWGAAGDIDGDGELDTVFGADVSLSANLGQGNGVFGGITLSDYGPFANPDRDQVLADMDGDGKRDYVGVNFGPQLLSVARGRGDGTFRPQASVTTPDRLRAVAVADLDGDGKKDAVVTGGKSTVFWGDGAGGFSGQTNVGMPGVALALADVDKRNGKDIVIAYDNGAEVGVALHQGGRAFSYPPTKYAAGSYPVDMSIADVDQDGWKDVAVIDPFSESVVVLINGRDGTFGRTFSVPVGARARDIIVADITNDKRPDILLTVDGDARSWVLINKGRR